LNDLPGISLQTIRPGNRCSYKDFSITIHAEQFGLSRDELAMALAAENIDTRKYYHPPVHRQTAYCQFALPEVDLTYTEQLAAESLSLPLWSQMDERTVQLIGQAIQRNHAFAAEVKAALREQSQLTAA
jgi:dTDP-4-amino-4,6-dideoxygalactose transaminase